MQPTRLIRSVIVLKSSTLLNLHQVSKNRKYRILFSPKHRRKPGHQRPSRELINVIVAMKQRNPSWGCPQIAQQVNLAFGVSIDKDIVRRILAEHYRPRPAPIKTDYRSPLLPLAILLPRPFSDSCCCLIS
jgi:putative transposase